MYDGRTNLARDVVAEVKRSFPGRVFHTLIPRSVRLAEAPSHGAPITVYDPHGAAAQAYRELAAEVVGTRPAASDVWTGPALSAKGRERKMADAAGGVHTADNAGVVPTGRNDE
jgi:hypothetical protein